MQKEPLTKEEIRKDLRSLIYDHVIDVFFCFIFFLIFLGLFWLCLRSKASLWNQSFVNFSNVLMALPPIVFLIIIIVFIIKIYKLYTIWKNPCNIVKERLGRKEIKYQLRKHRSNEFYCLYFPSHRAYEIPGENYKWSDLYYLSDKMVYTYADCGDEFYLVLSKPHTGKILLAYNAKMFDYQETPCNPTHPGV